MSRGARLAGRLRTRCAALVPRRCRGRGQAWLPVAAWALHGLGGAVFIGLYLAADGEGRWLPEAWHAPLVYMLLAAVGGLAGAAALAGAYLAILRCRARVAWGLVLLADFPALVAAAAWWYTLVFFRAG